MKKSFQRLVLLTVLFSVVNIAMADRGSKKKAAKSKIVLNIAVVPGSFRNSIPLNFSTGLLYTGSFFSSEQVIGNSIVDNAIITYEKGNTIYIIPYKQQKLAMHELKSSTSFDVDIQFH